MVTWSRAGSGMSHFPLISRCSEPGCRELTFAARCAAHTTAADNEVRAAVADAQHEVALAEAYLHDCRARLAAVEAQAGIIHPVRPTDAP